MIGKNGVSLLIGHNGVQDKTTLNAVNETVARGIYDATTLSTVDADLATANIKNGITLFGFAGSANVFDISDATAVEAEVLAPETFYAVSGGIRTGTMPTVALAPGSNAYPTGYHAGAANLTAVDGDLVTGNIKNGITIFNINGSVDVRDVSDANALVGEVMAGRTFYAVGGAIKTGTLATVAIVADNNAYPQGYHVGNGGGLSAIDVNLAPANIKSGVNIFGSIGVATVQEIGAANALVGEVKAGRTFFSVTGAIKTGTMPTVAIVAANDNYPAGYHAGDGGGLDAIDVHLAPGNIKLGVNIFGKVGTVAPAPTETIERLWEGNLAAGTAYTPNVAGLFSACLLTANLDARQSLAGAWCVMCSAWKSVNCIGDGASVSFLNGGGVARDFGLFRYHLSGATYEEYRDSTLAAGASYTPAHAGLFSMACDHFDIHTEFEFQGGWATADIGKATSYAGPLHIGDGTNFRVKSTAAAEQKYGLMRYIL